MSVYVSRYVWKTSQSRSGNRLVLLCLADFCDHNGCCYPSIRTVATMTLLTARRVRASLKELVTMGELDIDIAKGPHGTNRYRIIGFRAGSESKGMKCASSPPMQSTSGGMKSSSGGMKKLTGGEEVSDITPLKWASSNPSEEPVIDPPNKNKDKTDDEASPLVSAGSLSIIPKKPLKTEATWLAYADAYMKRYGVKPLRNAKVNGQLSQFIDQVGADDAPAIATFYVGHPEKFYLLKQHPVGMLLKDAEGLHTQWKTQVSITNSQLGLIEKQAQITSAVNAFKAKQALEAKKLPEPSVPESSEPKLPPNYWGHTKTKCD